MRHAADVSSKSWNFKNYDMNEIMDCEVSGVYTRTTLDLSNEIKRYESFANFYSKFCDEGG